MTRHRRNSMFIGPQKSNARSWASRLQDSLFMRTIGSPAELERRRFLALERIRDGFSAEEVAEFLGIHPSSVRRWGRAFGQLGAPGLLAQPAPGRPAKLTLPRR